MVLDCAAPSVGYDTDAKDAYRKQVWAALIPSWELTKHDERSHVLIMPSREGLEIPLLISLGVPEDRIVAVDKSAAVIATSKWRKLYPGVKFFSSTIGECGKKIEAKKWVICAANLDFCSNFCESIISEYSGFLNCPRFPEARIAITIAKGREGKALVAMLRRFSQELVSIQEPRLAALLACSGHQSEQIVWAQGKYTSNMNPMAWLVLSNNYVKDALINDHIQEFYSLDYEDASARVYDWCATLRLGGTERLRITKSDVGNWLENTISAPFVDMIKRHDQNMTVIRRKSIGMKYSGLDRAFTHARNSIWRAID